MTRALKSDIPGVDWRISPEELSERGLDAIWGDGFPKPLRPVATSYTTRFQILTADRQ